MGDIIIEEINYKAKIYSFISVITFITAILLVVYGFDHHIEVFWLPGLIISVVLLFFMIDSLLKAVKVKKLITITREGITDNTQGGLGYISFDDIKEFKLVTIYNKKAIAVIPKNVASFAERYSMAKHKFYQKHTGIDLPPYAIFVHRAKDMAAEDILTLLQKRLADIESLC